MAKLTFQNASIFARAEETAIRAGARPESGPWVAGWGISARERKEVCIIVLFSTTFFCLHN